MEEAPTSHSSFENDSLNLSQEVLSVNAKDKSGNTCLHNAIEKNQEADVDVILSMKDVDIEIKNDEGETPLMVAVKLGDEILVKKLLKCGANVNSEDNYSNSPLLQATLLNFVNIVEVLLRNGASCFVENNNAQTPLHMAIAKNSESIFDMLIEFGADVTISNNEYGTPMEAALTAANLKIARKLLANGASLDPPSVFYSLLNCYKKNFGIVFNFILENGFDVNARGSENWSLLHLAVLRRNVKVVDSLLKSKVNVNAKDNAGETPLHFAVRISNSSIIVKLLLEHKSDVNAVDVHGNTALHVAVKSFSDKMVWLLLNSGADMNIPQDSKCTPLAISLALGTFSRKVSSYLLFARKMNLANLRISFTQNDGIFPKNFTTLSAFESKCLEELDKIKRKKFGRISLNNIFVQCNNPLYVNSSDMKDFIESDNLEKEFPLYASLLKRMFRKGVKRNVLLDDVRFSVTIMKGLSVTQIVLPDELKRKVLLYLEDGDLLNVKRAFSSVKKNCRVKSNILL